MKKATITLSYDEEKLAALRLYLEQKGQTVENELVASVESLYAKTVPTNVRDFIDLRAGTPKPAEKKKKPKPPVSADPLQDGSENK